MTNDKPQLTSSMIGMISRCGEQFKRRYGARFGIAQEEEILPPGIALITGTATHKGVETNLRHRLENEDDPATLLECMEAASDSMDVSWSTGVQMTEEEVSTGAKKVKGAAKDMAVALSQLHHVQVAPTIKNITEVEKKFVLAMPGQPVDLAGQMDCIADGCIRDLKTAKMKPQEGAAKSIQMSLYAMAYKVLYNEPPKMVILDYLLKQKQIKTVTVMDTPDPSWVHPLFMRIDRIINTIDAVKKGSMVLQPAEPTHWICSDKWCGYARTCPFWSGR